MNNKVLITGSSHGIGQAIALKLSQTGYEIFLTGRDENALKTLCKKINAKGYLAIDLTQNNAAEILYNSAINTLEKIDILVNNAGEYFYGAIENINEVTLNRLLTLNTKIPYQLISYCVKNMKMQKM